MLDQSGHVWPRGHADGNGESGAVDGQSHVLCRPSVLDTIPVSAWHGGIDDDPARTGGHSLRASFNGQPFYTSSTSAVLAETVNAVAGNGFRAALGNMAVGALRMELPIPLRL